MMSDSYGHMEVKNPCFRIGLAGNNVDSDKAAARLIEEHLHHMMKESISVDCVTPTGSVFTHHIPLERFCKLILENLQREKK